MSYLRAIITPATAPLRGEITLPGDKSISHRRALLSLFVNDDVRLANYGTGDDCLTTLACLERLGKTVVHNGNDVVISGEWSADSAALDCGNSGTTARLLMGILAAHKGTWTLHGDASLSRRPMERVAIPLRQMGARIELMDGCLPARIEGAALHGIAYDSPVASAQVKSAVLLAGLAANGITRYRETLATRDHTERLLAIDADSERWTTLDPERIELSAPILDARIPGDPSSAAFWIVAALMVPDSKVSFPDMLANPHRTAYLDVLQHSGAKLERTILHSDCGEDAATIGAGYSTMQAFHISGGLSARMIDEIPAMAVLAAQCYGVSEFKDVGELRVKESDRLRLMADGLTRMCVPVRMREDGFTVEGVSRFGGARVKSGGDHRIAMALAVAGLAAESEVILEEAEFVRVSYPAFWDDFQRLAPGSVTFES